MNRFPGALLFSTLNNNVILCRCPRDVRFVIEYTKSWAKVAGSVSHWFDVVNEILPGAESEVDGPIILAKSQAQLTVTVISKPT